MSSPQSEQTAPAKEQKPAKKPKLTSSQQEIADRIALNAAERAGRESLSDSQIALARHRRLHKAGKKDPAVAEILDQNIAQGAVIEQLRDELVATQEAGASALVLVTEAGKVNQEQHAALEAAKANIEGLNGQILSQAGELEKAKSDLAAAVAKIAEQAAALEAAAIAAADAANAFKAQADELVKARADLGAALKSKK